MLRTTGYYWNWNFDKGRIGHRTVGHYWGGSEIGQFGTSKNSENLEFLAVGTAGEHRKWTFGIPRI